jgi:hypothetical protein
MRATLGVRLQDDAAGMAAVRGADRLLMNAGYSVARVSAALERTLPRAAAPAMPALQLHAVALRGAMVELRYRLINRPAGADLALHYRALRPAESVVAGEATAWAAAQDRGVLPATFVKGNRVLVFAQARDADLGCSYRFGAVRKELP